MITDKLENISKYMEIPEHIKDFVQTISKDIPTERFAAKKTYRTTEWDP